MNAPLTTPAHDAPAGALPVLELRSVCAGYGDTQVLRDIDLAIAPGSVAALLGPNGAGKTTLLRTAAGVVRPERGAVRVGGDDVTASSPSGRARAGVCLVPEGRGVFPSLTVAENLRLAVPPWADATAFEAAFEAFPVLADRRRQRAGTMSGGQQQMLALSRAYLADPRVVLLDEVSMGLAPRVVDEIFEALRGLAARGTALLLVEQYVHRALEMADAVHLLHRGALTYSGPPGGLDEDALTRGYLGVAHDDAERPRPAS